NRQPSCIARRCRVIDTGNYGSVDQTNSPAIISVIHDGSEVWRDGICVVLLRFCSVPGVQHSITVYVLAFLDDAVVPFTSAIDIFHVEFAIEIVITAAVRNIKNPTVTRRNVVLGQPDAAVLYRERCIDRKESVVIPTKEPTKVRH